MTRSNSFAIDGLPRTQMIAGVRSSRRSLLEHVAHDLVLQAMVERQKRPIEDDEIGALEQRARHVELLALRAGQAPAADADIEVEADIEHVVVEAELIQNARRRCDRMRSGPSGWLWPMRPNSTLSITLAAAV